MGPAATHDLGKPLHPSLCQALPCSGRGGGKDRLMCRSLPHTSLTAFPKQPLQQMRGPREQRKASAGKRSRETTGLSHRVPHVTEESHWKGPLWSAFVSGMVSFGAKKPGIGEAEATLRSSVRTYSHSPWDSHFMGWLSFFCSTQGSLALTE